MTMAYDRSPATGARTSARDHVLRPRLAATLLATTYGTNSSYLSRSHTAPHIDSLSTSSSTHVARISRTPGLAPALAGAGLERSSMPSRVRFTNVHSESSRPLARVAAPARTTSTRARSEPRLPATGALFSLPYPVDVAMRVVRRYLYNAFPARKRLRARLASSRVLPTRVSSDPTRNRARENTFARALASARPLAGRARRARARRSDSPSGRESRCRARRVHRPRAGSPRHTRARRSRRRRARKVTRGDVARRSAAMRARGVERGAREERGTHGARSRRDDRGIGRAMGERDARARATRFWTREGDGNVTWNAWNRVAARDAMGARGVGRQRDGRACDRRLGLPERVESPSRAGRRRERAESETRVRSKRERAVD